MNAENPKASAESAAAPAEDPGQPEKQDYSWRRKAGKRRLSRCRQETDQMPENDFIPAFSPPREQSGELCFELPESDLAGRVLYMPHPEDSRLRECAAVTVACLLGVILTTIAGDTVFNSGSDQTLDPALTTSAEARREYQAWSEVRRNSGRIPEAAAVMEAFLRARTPEEKVPFVRGGSAMLPAMNRYYASHPDEPEGFHLSPEAEHGVHDGREFLFIHGTDDFGKIVETAVECLDQGMRLDWRFLTGAGDMEWEDWRTQSPSTPVSMRAEASLDDYYSGEFADSQSWLCLKVTDAAHLNTVWAYVPKSTDAGVTIFRQLNARTAPVRLLGTFQFPVNPSSVAKSTPQVQLINVAAQGWLDSSPGESRPSPTPGFSGSISPTLNEPHQNHPIEISTPVRHLSHRASF